MSAVDRWETVEPVSRDPHPPALRAPVEPEPEADDGSANDYALARVPQSARTPWFNMATQRFGQLASLAQFWLGATLGVTMDFWPSLAALLVGTVILEVLGIIIGFAGAKEGMSTSVLARWTGFGNKGSAILGLLIVVSLAGWFGVQSGILAAALNLYVPAVPVWMWCFISGFALTLLAWKGFQLMTWVARITLPAFVIITTGVIIFQLTKHSFSDIIARPVEGNSTTFGAGITMVIGIFIIGAVMAPDMTRFSRSKADVVKHTVVGITLGEFVTGLSGILLARIVGSSDPVAIISTTAGSLGIVVIVASIININTWNLYGASLGTVNAIDTLLHKSPSRGLVTLILGGVGSLLAAIGLAQSFDTFLTAIGVLFPPVGGIIAADYFLVKSWDRELRQTTGPGKLPPWAPQWIPMGLVVWIIAAAIGFVTEKMGVGIASINSLMSAFGLFCLAGWFGLTDFGIGSTYEPKRSLPDEEYY